jgi:hypothetical protein
MKPVRIASAALFCIQLMSAAIFVLFHITLCVRSQSWYYVIPPVTFCNIQFTSLAKMSQFCYTFQGL